MEGEIESFIKVWISSITSLCYCYFIVARIPRGMIRLLSLLPICYLFIILPFNLSSFHLGGPTSFYLVWLANFKLLLFSFDLGPLSSHPPKPLLHFISIALLPIQIKQHPSLQSPLNAKNNTNPSLLINQSPPNLGTRLINANNNTNPSLLNNQSSPDLENPSTHIVTKVPRSVLLAVKVVFLAMVICIYDYKQHLHPYVILTLYCCHVYLGIEITLAGSAALGRATLGLEFEPQFHEPYLATSLQDFWGRRWNLMVTGILRPTVYNPIRRVSARLLGRVWAPLPAIVAAFLVSGLMHEVIFFYLTRVGPTWEVTWFFLLHGICTAAEVVAKKAVTGRWRLHRAVSGPLTVGFVAVTGVWLFLPQMTRNGVDEKAIKEYSTLVNFVKDKVTKYNST